jgi:uncharacterized protein
MIHAMAHCGAVLDNPKYTDSAISAANFVLTHLRDHDGRLLRTCGLDEHGKVQNAKLTGYLDDYAYLALGLVMLYEATFDVRWIHEAEQVVEKMIRFFSDSKGGFYYTAHDHEQLITRTKDMQDGSVPSGNATAALAMIKLARLTDRQDLLEKAERTVNMHYSQMDENPMSATQMLIAQNLLLGPTEEIVIVGEPNSEEVKQVVRKARSRFSPHCMIAVQCKKDDSLALFKDRVSIDGKVTVYYCKDRTCSSPWVGVSAVLQGLSALK